jgi:hypothetical protein
MVVNETTHVVEQIRSQPIEMEREYRLACDSYDLKQNVVLSEFASAHPECIPGEDAGE